MVCQLIQDHPRRCGENKEAQAIKVLCTGSPPQVRGKQNDLLKAHFLNGITPAGAGKTLPFIALSCRPRDHPRRCGENVELEHIEQPIEGSPPQVRGKRFVQLSSAQDARITPAGAGKTAQECQCRKPLEDHPRRCGENKTIFRTYHVNPGSPPQVRGKPYSIGIPGFVQRITPAGAGKTADCDRCKCDSRDHPRRCGENTACRCGALGSSGSPPQVRGKQP